MRKIVILMLLVFGLTAAGSTPALAFDELEMENGCHTALLECFERAATIDNFWYRLAAALWCEYDYLECARPKRFGY